jgi:hypothetical protein
MNDWPIPADVKEGKSSTTPTEWCLFKLMKMRATSVALLPLTMYIVEDLLTMPISNAWSERGASKVRIIKTRLRSRLKNPMLECLMNISINGPDVESQECDDLIRRATHKWLSSKRYKLAKKPIVS